jgi:hypothetical protein
VSALANAAMAPLHGIAFGAGARLHFRIITCAYREFGGMHDRSCT